ncbi:basic secretory family protein [Aspergillus homomorphus CBS 101889]|uniref:BSP-domain-containing protein n=1 Tax=Aspergillus homomorphus (strain CBS 101889) TaxID=1450537 RepID=A0A395HUP8_ASPHC|nr:BSP-domain-containing protein [Aspergillus homomorphus CBS 101889]RAL11115.1 BSP-domain-containing protein [Aspergillus homomorphus CBS 101889]
MASSTPRPQPTTLPFNLTKPDTNTTTNTTTTTNPQTIPHLPTPKLLLQIHDLRNPASTTFLTLIPNLASTLETALTTILQTLYTKPTPPSSPSTPTPTQTPIQNHNRITFTPTLPPTRSITTHLRQIPGVAYTTGTDLDADHKEIHLSLSYIASCTTRYADPRAELVGMLTHELVHCYQHTRPQNKETQTPDPPGGLIEGIADFVRLRAGLAPPHWTRPRGAEERAGKWDQGYQHTAYFLDWLEEVRIGTGAVGLVNDRLLRVGYVGEGEGEGDDGEDEQVQNGDAEGESFWKGLFGVGVEELWEEYGRWLDTPAGKVDEETKTPGNGNWEGEIVNP